MCNGKEQLTNQLCILFTDNTMYHWGQCICVEQTWQNI